MISSLLGSSSVGTYIHTTTSLKLQSSAIADQKFPGFSNDCRIRSRLTEKWDMEIPVLPHQEVHFEAPRSIDDDDDENDEC